MRDRDNPIVLYIDDRADDLDAFGQLMQEGGINVISANDVDSATRAIKYANFDMVVCDLNLSAHDLNDKSGIDIAKFVAIAKPGVPVFGISGIFSKADLSAQERSLFTRVYAKGTSSSNDLLLRVKELRSFAIERRTSAHQARQSVRGATAHDVFLCHNSLDKDVVRRLATRLHSRQIRPWFDEWDLVPGRTWQEALEQAIQGIPAAAILIGGSGIGPWEDREMRAFLGEFVRRGVAVIPVLLPGAPVMPDLPLFLREFTWVDMREGLRRPVIDRLVWGITGKKP